MPSEITNLEDLLLKTLTVYGEMPDEDIIAIWMLLRHHGDWMIELGTWVTENWEATRDEIFEKAFEIIHE